MLLSLMGCHIQLFFAIIAFVAYNIAIYGLMRWRSGRTQEFNDLVVEDELCNTPTESWNILSPLDDLRGLNARYPRKILPAWNKFIYSTTCGGFGNQLFKFASIYGLGKRLNREPFYNMLELCIHELEAEMVEDLPNFYERIIFFTPPESVRVFKFDECCDYVVPEDSLYGEKASQRQRRRVCVHTRRGDFVPNGIGTTREFTIAALDVVLDTELTKHDEDITVLLLGLDQTFLEDIKNTKMREKRERVDYVLPASMSRTIDFCYGVETCDALLITAHSTYSWWMAYLLRDGATVYYYADFRRTIYKPYNYLPEWTPIVVD